MINWPAVRLVVFDVDGTLYNQQALRRRMALRLLHHCWRHRSTRTLRLLKAYRQRREALASYTGEFSEDRLINELANVFQMPQSDVHSVVHDWIHERPLREIGLLRYHGVKELFETLKYTGRTIGVLSDHPAREKLLALQLSADHVLSADDQDVRALKPDPRGLRIMMERSKVGPDATIMIGDRPERDGEMGRRANVTTYIRSTRARQGWPCFDAFEELTVGLSTCL